MIWCRSLTNQLASDGHKKASIERKKIPRVVFLQKRKTDQMLRGYKIKPDTIKPIEEPDAYIRLIDEKDQDITQISNDDESDCRNR